MTKYIFKSSVTSFFLLLTAFGALGQKLEQKTELVAPPYQAHSSNFIMVMFHLPAKEVNSLLPKGIVAKQNQEGMVQAAFEMYGTDRIYGVPNYKAAFLVVDIQNHESANGTAGHYAIWGNLSDAKASFNFIENFGIPFSHNEKLTLNNDLNTYSGVVELEDKEQIQLVIDKVESQPFNDSGIVNMIGQKSPGQFITAEVPWLSKGYAGKLIKFESNVTSHPALKLLKDVTPFWALISNDQIFSYSKPF